jgi:hypothetical protein
MTAPRRWLRYSLRTLFVLVTALCIVGGWVVNEVRFVNARLRFDDAIFDKGAGYSWPTWTPSQSRPWWFREWLGDELVERIYVPTQYAEQFRSEAARLHPESVFIALSEEEMNKLDRPCDAPDTSVPIIDPAQDVTEDSPAAQVDRPAP